MIKRLNKVTPLLVAVATISTMTTISANAAEYERVSYEDGSINEAVAYKDGKFYIDGDIADSENEGIYYLSDKKYNSLEDLYVGSDVNLYGEKYLNIDSNEYFLDLSTGELVDDDIQNDLEYAKVNLRKKTRNKTEDRYSDHNVLKNDLEELPSSKFAEAWYGTTFISDIDGRDISVYTDKNGNYIDADYNVGKVKVTTKNKIITLKNTDDIEKGTNVSISDPIVLAHDEKYIYRKATMTVNSDEEITKINGIDMSAESTLFNLTDDKTSVSFDVIQKISKEQSSGTIDGAKYSNNVTNYVVGKKNGAKVGFMQDEDTAYSISKGKIIAHKISDGKITAQSISLRSENGTNFTGIKKAEPETFSDYDVDVNGNLWIVSAGFIYKYNNAQDWVKTYKVDKSMDSISVYDENNLITWNEDSEIYSIVNKVPVSNTQAENAVNSENESGSDIVNTENEIVDEKLKFGWDKNDDGTWSFINSDSTYFKGWLKENSTWYYLDENGIMQTGWIKYLNKWYYLREDGSMVTGWIKVSDKWYYLNNDGSMVYNEVVSGYSLGSDGAMI